MADEAPRLPEHRPRLGRGLAALLGDSGDAQSTLDRSHGLRKVPIEFLRPNPKNPRKSFGEDELEELTASIRERGVIQPVLVRTVPRVKDTYEIIAGERRWRAAQRAGQHDIPILILEVGDREALEIAIVENVQRSDLNALEEGRGYKQLMDDHGYSHADIARVVGKSRSHVANTLRLSGLPARALALLESGEISAGHARALLSVADPDAVADRVLEQRLTVREVEQLNKNVAKSPRHAKNSVATTDPDTRALETKLAATLGVNVSIRNKGDSGEMRIQFRNFEQLDDFCRRLNKPVE